ncbi:DET1- and DDB1-associated protein 1 [Halotydeus destructor]|nr:DET1- and DDB1-associated protein 1 [Halotydeus destructor]
MSSTAKYLQDLPSVDKDNFSRYQPDASFKISSRRPSVYLPTKEHGPPSQIITTEKTNILLRYLHQQFDKKNKEKSLAKRLGSVEPNDPQRKKARTTSPTEDSN